MTRIRFRTALLVGAAASLIAAAAATAAVGINHSATKEGGTLVVGLTAGEPDALDPTLARTFSGREVFLTFCEKLYDLNAKAQIVPQLASALPTISKDKLTVTIPLRTGHQVQRRHAVQRRGGREDAAARPDDDGLGPCERDLADRQRHARPAPSTVVIHLKTPYSPLTAQLADRAGMIMSPAQLDKLGDKFATQPDLRRRVHLRNRVAGDSITVTKSPYYYDKKNVHLDKIVFKVENDAAAAAAALKAGDLQALDGIDSTQLPAIRADTNAAHHQADGARLPGHHAQHRQQERPRKGVLERRHADRLERQPAQGVRGWRSTARR